MTKQADSSAISLEQYTQSLREHPGQSSSSNEDASGINPKGGKDDVPDQANNDELKDYKINEIMADDLSLSLEKIELEILQKKQKIPGEVYSTINNLCEDMKKVISSCTVTDDNFGLKSRDLLNTNE